METRNLKIKDGEDVDVLWRPVYKLASHQNLCVTRAYDATTYKGGMAIKIAPR